MDKAFYTYCRTCDKVQKSVFCDCGDACIALSDIKDAPRKDYYVVGSQIKPPTSGGKIYWTYNTLKDMIKRGH